MRIKSDITKLLSRSNKVTQVKVLSRLSITPQAQGLEKGKSSEHLLPRGTYHLARAERTQSNQRESKRWAPRCVQGHVSVPLLRNTVPQYPTGARIPTDSAYSLGPVSCHEGRSAVHSALWSQRVWHLKGVFRKWLMQVGRLPVRGLSQGLFRGAPASQSSFNTPPWGKHSRNEGFKPANSWPCYPPQVSPSLTPASETLRWGWGSGTVRRGGTWNRKH